MKQSSWRAALFNLCLLTLLVVGEFILRFRVIFDYDRARMWADRLASRMSRTVFAVTAMYMDHQIARTSSVARSQLPSQFVLIANHQSIVDIPILLSSFPHHSLRFTAKRSLFRFIPLVSLVLRVQRHAAVYRGSSNAKTLSDLRRLARMCEEGISPVVFPEGTRSRTGELNRFQPGAMFLMAKNCQIPVVCVSMDGGYRVADASSLGRNIQGCRYRVHIEKIYDPPKTRQQTELLLGDSEARIRARLISWRQKKQAVPALPEPPTPN